MGCGASAKKGEGSPSLNEYFKELKEYSNGELDDLMELYKLKAKEPADADAVKTKMTAIKAKREAFAKVATRLLTDSFNHHDVSNDGILSTDESSTVFQHITNEKTQNDATMAKAEQRRMLAMQLGLSKKYFDKYDVENEDALKKGGEAEMKADAAKNIEVIEKQMKDKLEDYRKNKAERDKVAFAVLDVSKDGRIQKKEFLAAFDQESELYATFMAALGLNAQLETEDGAIAQDGAKP